MLENQNFLDLQQHEEEEEGSFGDPRSWLLGEDHSSPPHPSQHSNGNGNGSHFDPVLYKNLVEVLPLLESFMDKKSKTSYTRRASLICTKTPSKEVDPKKGREPKGKKMAQLIPAIKRMDLGDNKPSKDGSVDDFSVISSRTSTAGKDREELIALQEQVENLQQELLEKDELLKSAGSLMNQMRLANAKIDGLKRQVAEKESLIKSAHLQLSDVQVKLADKQAALERIQWEVTTSNRKVEELHDKMESIRGEKAAFMLLFENLTSNGCTAYAEDYDTLPSYSDNLPCRDDVDKKEMQEMEEAREAYISAVAAAKENEDEELLAIAAQARLRLQTFILRPKDPTSSFHSL